MRGKDEYELGDLTMALDKIGKDMTCQLTGKDDYEGETILVFHSCNHFSCLFVMPLTHTNALYVYCLFTQAGDLTTEIDSRVKSSVADFCGKDEYEVGDLSSEVDRRARAKVFEFIGTEVRRSGHKRI